MARLSGTGSRRGSFVIQKNSLRQELRSDPWILAETALLALFLSWFFYRSVWCAVMTAPLVLPLCRQRSRERRQKRKETLALEFREALGSMITAMKAGSSADNAVRETCREMAFLYGKGSGIYREFYLMQQGLDSHVPLEQLMTEFGERSSIPDIQEFAQTFGIAKKNGGSMTEIMARTIQLLQDRIAVEKEISVLISARKLEQRIMIMVPFLIVLYLGAASEGFFDPLYHNMKGVLVMTGCLVTYTAACRWSYRIMDIRV